MSRKSAAVGTGEIAFRPFVEDIASPIIVVPADPCFRRVSELVGERERRRRRGGRRVLVSGSGQIFRHMYRQCPKAD